MNILGVILFNIFIAAITAFLAWVFKSDPREAAETALYVCFGLDAAFLFIKLLSSDKW